METVAEARSSKTEREGPPNADGPHAEGESKKVGKGNANKSVSDKGVKHHGAHTLDGTQGVGIGDLEAVTQLIAGEGWQHGNEEEGDIMACSEEGDEGTACQTDG